jgi:hypothetical protein
MSYYDWSGSTANMGLPGMSWFNPQQTAAATLPMPAGVMPAANSGWGGLPGTMPTAAGLDFASTSGMGMKTPDVPAAEGGGFMNWLRGAPGKGGDGATGWLGNGQNLGAAVQGIGALTGAWLGYQQMKVAKDQLNFQKDAWAKNYGNSVKTYNTSLEDRIRGRTADYSGKEGDVQSYLDKNRLG